ncbi:allophanate hydrolase subunit 1 [Amnibacterium flavum]|uniref:Allophanate hydrolase n=1 Tax=Amnibacterium flavum TaxID=2173173 RepID=A0A2V1HVH2_9MICO|nr:allophanate hydrolase subunit 1 [Amnibacterium flavum]PVZ95000.1 allophanate hydrolase [Amnibacterium flavum]
MRVLPYGDRALLAEYGDAEETIAAYRALEATRPPGVVALVPAARTVLVRVEPTALTLGNAERWVRETEPIESEDDPGALVVIPVHYDGPDLSDTADLLGMSVAGLIAAHSAADWRCGFVGFSPGFGYLSAADWAHEVPRLATSRPRVPAGSVAVAAGFAGVYPRESPGGWRILGRTDADLWDVDRTPPALLIPGARVRFEAIP